jgi:predicted anti-sigma-YlaC factor YlaD
VSSCTDTRDLFAAVLENEASEAETEQVRSHLDGCVECAELYDAMGMIIGAGDFLGGLEPPPHIGEEIASSPCRRWLGLLYQAVDREISKQNLERLLTHLGSCPSCRRVWHDLTLIHQVGDSMRPPNHLLQKCIKVREAVARIAILPRRTATAAAYILALLASLAIGNPTIIAQDLHAVATEKVAKAATGVSEVAADGRGEARVVLWRAMNWGEQKVNTVRGWIDRLRDNDDDVSSETNSDTDTHAKPQGESS